MKNNLEERYKNCYAYNPYIRGEIHIGHQWLQPFVNQDKDLLNQLELYIYWINRTYQRIIEQNERENKKLKEENNHLN